MKIFILRLFLLFAIVPSALAATVTVTSYSGNEWRYGGSAAELRIFLDRQIITAGGKVLARSVAGENDPYKKIDCDVLSGTIICESFTIDSTTDARPSTAKYTFVIYDEKGEKRNVLGVFKIPSKPSVTSIANLVAYNDPASFGSQTNPSPAASKFLKDFSSLSAAIASIGSREEELVVDQNVEISSNTNIPPNIRLKLTGNSGFRIADGATLAIASRLDAGYWQIFEIAGTGKVTFPSIKPVSILPEWWGAKPDDSSAAQQSKNVAATQAAINAASNVHPKGGNVVFTSGGTYFFNGTISLDDLQGIALTGSGMAAARLTYTGSGAASFITLRSSQRISISNLEITYDNVNYVGNLISTGHSKTGGDSGYLEFKNLTLRGIGKARSAAALIRLNLAIIVEISGCRFYNAAIGIIGNDAGRYSNVVSVRNCTFMYLTVAAIKNAIESWLFDTNTIEPLASGACVFYTQDKFASYNLNFKNNWVGDCRKAADAITATAYGMTLDGNRFELASGSKAMVIGGGSQGISITGNRTNSIAVDFGSGSYSRGILIAGNSFNAVSPIIGDKFVEYTITANNGIANSTDLTSNFYNRVNIYSPVEVRSTFTMGTGGTPISKIVSQAARLDFGATQANGCDDLDISGFSGLSDGDVLSLGVSVALARYSGTAISGFVKNSTTVTVRRCNATSRPAGDPPASIVRVQVNQF